MASALVLTQLIRYKSEDEHRVDNRDNVNSTNKDNRKWWQRIEFNVNTSKFNSLIWDLFNVILIVDIILKVSKEIINI